MFEKLKKDKKLNLDDDYFKKLMIYMDLTKIDTYCDHVSGRMLAFLRLSGFLLTYSVIYVSRPIRIYRLLKNLFKKEFSPNNLFEQRIYDFFVRLKLNKKTI